MPEKYLTLGGRLEGTGTVHVGSTLVCHGTISPGLSVGRITIQGRYTQESSGTLEVELAGLAAGTEYDQLAITDTASLSGILKVTLSEGFIPHGGDQFRCLTCASRSGEFTTLDLPSLPADLQWRVVYSNSFVELRVTTPDDTDGDRLPDTWEIATFGDLQMSDGANSDFDQDWFNDYEEYVAGTDPLDETSHLRVGTIRAGHVIGWPAVSGRTYAVEATVNLALGSWMALTNGLSATPPHNVWTNTVWLSEPIYYRIRVNPAP